MKPKVTSTQKALNIWAIILILWSIYRIKFQFPVWFDEFIAKPLVFVLPVFIYIKLVEKKDFLSNVYLKTYAVINELFLGLLVGLTFFMSVILGNYVKYGSLSFLDKFISYDLVTWTLLIALATAVSEEILSRGFILKRIYEESKNTYTAILFSAILFFFLHIPILFTNVKITGNILIAFVVLDFTLSIVNSVIFLERKSLYLPIMIHAFYNFSLLIFI